MERNKVLAAMSGSDLEVTRAMAERVRRYARPHTQESPVVPFAVPHAIADNLVVTIGYGDRQGDVSSRSVEPVGVLSLDEDWYLVGWCRLREEARTFRLDRIHRAELTDERAPVRDPDRFLEFMPWLVERPSPLH